MANTALAINPICQQVNLSSLFPGPPIRNQNNIQNCSIFSATALYEAELKINYNITLPLSEADAFVQSRMAHTLHFLGPTFRQHWDESDPKNYIDETNSIYSDLLNLQQTGMVPQFYVPYQEFCNNFDGVTENVINQVQTVFSNCQMDNSNPESSISEFQKAKELIRTFFSNTNFEHLLYPSVTFDLTSTRNLLKNTFASFIPIKEVFSSPAESDQLRSDHSKCQELSSTIFNQISSILCMGHPVAVMMNISHYPRLNKANHDNLYHALVITGLQKNEEGKYMFQTRNSWGGFNPSIPTEDLCRITSMQYFLYNPQHRISSTQLERLQLLELENTRELKKSILRSRLALTNYYFFYNTKLNQIYSIKKIIEENSNLFHHILLYRNLREEAQNLSIPRDRRAQARFTAQQFEEILSNLLPPNLDLSKRETWNYDHYLNFYAINMAELLLFRTPKEGNQNEINLLASEISNQMNTLSNLSNDALKLIDFITITVDGNKVPFVDWAFLL